MSLAGTTVMYRLTAHDASAVGERRTEAASHANTHREGDTVPMLIVRDWGDSVNGQASIDGNFTLWVTSAKQGTEPGQWDFGPATFSAGGLHSGVLA